MESGLSMQKNNGYYRYQHKKHALRHKNITRFVYKIEDYFPILTDTIPSKFIVPAQCVVRKPIIKSITAHVGGNLQKTGLFQIKRKLIVWKVK